MTPEGVLGVAGLIAALYRWREAILLARLNSMIEWAARMQRAALRADR